MSPVRPENRDRYPADWKRIARDIKVIRALNRCECQGECGGLPEHIAADGCCPNVHGEPGWGNGKPVVMTCAHLNHQPEDCSPANLAALCAPCHCRYDRHHHAETAAATRARAAGQPPLPGLDPAN